jgi:hypothetical protein
LFHPADSYAELEAAATRMKVTTELIDIHNADEIEVGSPG